MDYTIIGVVILFILVVLYFVRNGQVKGLMELDAHEFKQAIDEKDTKRLIDVREPFEYQSGHLQGAVNIPLSRLQEQLNSISSDQPIFLYCQSGMRSKQAARLLIQQGFTSVTHLRGGIMAWQRSGLQII